MKLINEKGKLFGLINVIDLMVVLFLVLIGVVALKVFLNKETPSTVTNASEITITYYLNHVRDVSVEAIQEGDAVYEVNSKQSFGTVVSKEVVKAKVMTTDEEGQVKYVELPDRYDMYIKIKTEGVVTEQDVSLNNENIKIGYLHLVDLKNIRFEGVVFGLEY